MDQRGSFMAAVAAGPVFRLLGKKDLGTSEFPEVETAIIDGELAFRQHKGGHTTGPNWPTFLAFADRYIKLKDAPGNEAPRAKSNRGSPPMTGRIPRLSPPSLLAFALVALARASRAKRRRTAGGHVGGLAPQRTEPANMPPCAGLADATLRQVVRVFAHAGVGATALA